MRVPTMLFIFALLLSGCGGDGDRDGASPAGSPSAPADEDPVPTGPVHYVATTGDDAGPGTIDQPWRTIGKAAQAAVAGDTIIIRGGVYKEPLAPANSGAGESARIEFRGLKGEDIVLEGGTAPLTGWTYEGNKIYRKNIFKNNIITECGFLTLRLDLPGGENSDFWDNHFENNCFWTAQLNPWGSWVDIATAQAKWPNVFKSNIGADPVLLPDDHLGSGSPCIDSGQDVGEPFGGGAPDMGRFEY